MENYITIGGKKRPLYFGMNGIRRFCKQYEIDLQGFADAFTSLDMDRAICMITIALEEGSRKAGKKQEYSIEDVSDWIDENFEVFGEATQAILEGLPFKTAEEAEKEPPQKTTEGNVKKQVAG